MPIWLNKASLYILAWCVYFYQGIIFPQGSIITQLLLVFLLVVSLYYVFIANVRYKLPKYFVGLNFLLALFSIYGAFIIIFPYDNSQVASSEFIKQIYVSLLPIYTFYVFSKENLINDKSIRLWTIALIFMTIGLYFSQEKKMLLYALMKNSLREEFTNNVGYLFTSLVPMCVFFRKKPIIQYIALAVCLVFMVMAMKRGALVIGLVCTFIILWNNISKVNIKSKIIFLVLSCILSFMCIQFVENQIEQSNYMKKRIEQTTKGDSSNRDKLYSTYLDFFVEQTSPSQFIFGTGANGTLQMVGYAHNDWLEIAINHGMMGLIIYLFYWLLFAKTSWGKDFKGDYRLVLQLVFIDFLLRTFFSMSYREMEVGTQLILGFALAQERKNEQICYSN